MSSIREVAKIAGVSPSTVSRVINNTANVDEEKRQRVLDAIEKTGFRPNELARALFKKSSKIIGVIVPTIENPFFNELAKAIEEEAYELGYRILLCNSNGNEMKELVNIEMLRQMHADGLIIMTNSNKTGRTIASCDMPVVMVDRTLKEDYVISTIESDHYQGGRIATEHLIECGCESIVCLRGPQQFSSGRKRYQGYKDVCEQYGIKEQWIECEYNHQSGMQAARELLQKYPDVDGVIASNDMAAMGVYKVLHGEGYSVPEDIQIIGFDNIRMSWLFTPELTTVTQPIKDMGRVAVQTIMDYNDGKKVQQLKVLDVSLVERQTTKRKEQLA